MSWRQAGATSSQPSQKWNRLKEVKLDPLEAIGLPSKGDNRLLDFKTQEDYFTRIVDRYKNARGTNGHDNSPLETALTSLSIHDAASAKNVGASNARLPVPETTLTTAEGAESREMATIIAAMRKLREAMVASARTDTFALKAYIFIIRATIMTGHMESYHPALLHLLRKIVPANPLQTKTDASTFVGYYILDLACRQGDLGSAFHVVYVYKYEDESVKGALKAMVRGDWCLYWRSRERMDQYQRQLCQWGDEKMKMHALNCLGASYLSVQKEYVEEVARQKWRADGLGKMKPKWELEEGTVVIKRIKKR